MVGGGAIRLRGRLGMDASITESDAWPRRFWTVFGSAPAPTSIVAAPWRRSWNRRRGLSACADGQARLQECGLPHREGCT